MSNPPPPAIDRCGGPSLGALRRASERRGGRTILRDEGEERSQGAGGAATEGLDGAQRLASVPGDGEDLATGRGAAEALRRTRMLFVRAGPEREGQVEDRAEEKSHAAMHAADPSQRACP